MSSCTRIRSRIPCALAIDETERRRKIQQEYNEEHGITPTTIQKSVRDLISYFQGRWRKEEMKFEKDPESMNQEELKKLIADIQKKMEKAAADLNFEAAAELPRQDDRTQRRCCVTCRKDKSNEENIAERNGNILKSEERMSTTSKISMWIFREMNLWY